MWERTFPGLASICAENMESSSKGEGQFLRSFLHRTHAFLVLLCPAEVEKCLACSCLFSGSWRDCVFLNTVSLGRDHTESQAYFPRRCAFSVEPKETLKFIFFDLTIVKMKRPRSRGEVSARCVNSV